MYSCPVCNGFTTLLKSCPICAAPLEDHGRVSDQYGDYSPYQEVDLCKQSDGLLDLHSHLCPHQCFCSSCGHSHIAMVDEQR